MDFNEFILHERRRGDCYRLLSACFYLPKKELYLEEDLFENLSMLLKTVCPDAAIFSTQMGEAIKKYGNEELAVEYAKLFVGPYELKAPPYGSIYLDQGRRVMGDSTMEVSKIFEEAGLSIDDNFKELPDHISVELEFMYYLIHKEVEALENSEVDKVLSLKETQALFLNRFLRQWAPRFCSRMKESTENEFYNALADCVLCFLSHLDDTKHFDLIVKKNLWSGSMVMRSFDELISDASTMHRGCVCPGQVLGVRMAMLGCRLLGIDEPTQDKRLIVYVEIDRCMADAIAAVTGCRLGKRTLKHMDYGKCACTFVDTVTGCAVRISARDDAREHVWSYAPFSIDKSAAQCEAYKVMPDDELFVVQKVVVHTPDHDRPGRPVSRVKCAICGEGVNDRREVQLNGLVLCRTCAHGSYYHLIGNLVSENSKYDESQSEAIPSLI